MLTLKDVAASCGLPESTLRLYRDEFEDLIPAHGEGRRRRYAPDGADALRLVAVMRKEGKAPREIREELAKRARPREQTRRRTAEDRVEEIAAAVRAQTGEMALLRAEVGALRAHLRELTALLRHEATGGASMEELQARFVAEGGDDGPDYPSGR